jgi:uroporphyrin-III C-methyltransferase
VGKERANHTMRQEDINELMVRLAKDGRRVLRLKGGDPFVFGRGGEEIDTLFAQGVRFEVVPGITAALGVAAYAGIPLTHRDHAQACTFVTGHLKDGTMDLDWTALARPRQTIVVYMGLTALPVLCERLVEHGLAPDTPAAVVQQGTSRAQRVVTGTLSTLPGRAAQRARLKAPTLIIVGSVVKLRTGSPGSARTPDGGAPVRAPRPIGTRPASPGSVTGQHIARAAFQPPSAIARPSRLRRRSDAARKAAPRRTGRRADP